MPTRAYQDGFYDGWSDTRNGRPEWRTAEPIVHSPFNADVVAYKAEYKRGYSEGVRLALEKGKA